MTAGKVARRHYAAAMDEARKEGFDLDAVARTMLSEVIRSMLQRRGVADVRAEILGAAENVDPDTDYMFMRP